MAEPRFSRPVENLIANLRGVPEDNSVSKPRPTRTLGELVDRLIHRYHVGKPSAEDAIREAWPRIVGEPNATLCHPLRIERERTLLVAVSNPIVRQELIFHKKLVLERLRALPVHHTINDVVFRSG